MITEQHNIDLKELADNFTVCGDYTKEVILNELEGWQKSAGDFLVLISNGDNGIDGFLIGYRNRNSLWLAQVWRKNGTSIRESKHALEIAKDWAREKGMTSITGETDRKEIFAMERLGFKEESVNMKVEL